MQPPERQDQGEERRGYPQLSALRLCKPGDSPPTPFVLTLQVAEHQEKAIAQLAGDAAKDYKDTPLFEAISAMFEKIQDSDEIQSIGLHASIPNPFVSARAEFKDIADRILYQARRFINEKKPSYVAEESLSRYTEKVFGKNWEATFQNAFDEGFYRTIERRENQKTDKQHSETDDKMVYPHHTRGEKYTLSEVMELVEKKDWTSRTNNSGLPKQWR